MPSTSKPVPSSDAIEAGAPPLQVRDGDRVSPLGGIKQRSVLAILLLRANQVVSTDRLIDELWGDRPPKTAGHALQVFVSDLRRALGAPAASEGAGPRIVTRAPGYLIEVEPGQLDLHRFERLAEQGRRALGEGRAEAAAEALREALSLWRGAPLADLAYEPFAQPAMARLEELRLAVVEDRIDAELVLGQHRQLVAELQALVAEHPLRERLRGQLMLALYRSGNQAEALDAYQDARRSLTDGLGIEPTKALQELELAILNHDPGLDPEPPMPDGASAAEAAPARSILVAPASLESLDALLEVAGPLTRRPPREIIIGALVADPDELGSAGAGLVEARTTLAGRGVSARIAAFTSNDWGADLIRLASEQGADLLLVDAPASLIAEAAAPPELASLWEGAPCDVAALVADQDRRLSRRAGRPIIVPFGGGEHDWAAVEIGAWLAVALGSQLRLLGSAARRRRKKRDASRLLAGAGLIVQRVAGIAPEPVLAPPGADALLAAASEAGLLVVGLPDRSPRAGLGEVRGTLAREAAAPMLLVRCGLRPSGLSPPERLTRYTWSLGEAEGTR